MSQSPAREQTLFHAAAKLPPAERAAFLDRECAGDAALRAAVEALLKSGEPKLTGSVDAPTIITPVGARLADPAGPGGTMVVTRTPSKPGAPVKLPPEAYHVGGEIARGGMGSILEAEDRKLGRKVAMKVMKLEASASEAARARFIREATVLARLEHPNIVPIHELGWDAEQRLFYTMKLVQGRTLEAVINGLKERDPDFVRHYTLDRLLTIFRKICDALAMAHAKGVIHRDLKPENVMVGEFGEVLVMDWGIAKILGDAKQAAEEASGGNEVASAHGVRRPESPPSDGATASAPAGALHALRESEGATPVPGRIPLPPGFQELSAANLRTDPASLTLDGTIMGTPHYMSPEQAEGRVTEIDPQSDVFSLGAILYALLTLHPPVEADSPYDVLELIKRGEIRPPTDYNAPTTKGGRGPSLEGAPVNPKKYQPLPHCPGGKVPPALSAVTMRALTVDKARRYPTVAAFAADIEAYQGGFATRAEQASLMKQLILLIQRHKGVFATAFAAWVIITALAVWFVLTIRASERKATANAELAAKNAQEAKAEATRAVAAEKLAEEKEENTRRALAKSQIALAESAYRDHDAAAMQAALKDVPDDLRDSNWSYLLEHADNSVASTRRDLVEVAPHPKKPGVFALLAIDGSVTLWEPATGIRLFEFKSGVKQLTQGGCHFAISPDGERFAIGADTRGIVIHSAVDGSKLAEWDADPSSSLQFSPDGTQLLQVSKTTSTVSMLDAATGKAIWIWKSEGDGVQTRGVFSPDGRKVLTFSTKERLRLVSARDGSVVISYPFGTGGDGGIAFRPNSSRILAAAQDGVVRCLQQGGDGQLIFQFRAEDSIPADITYTADGSRIVTLANLTGGQQSIKVWDADTGALLQTLMGGTGAGRRVRAHPLSGEIMVAGQTSKVWTLPVAQEKWTFAYSSRSLAGSFWGTDDLILSPANTGNAGTALLDLRTPKPKEKPLWQPTRPSAGNFGSVTVSADGRFAVIGNALPGPVVPKAVQFLRLNGNAVEVVKEFTTKTLVNSMQLSPDGAMVRIAHKLFDPSTGKELSDLKDQDVVVINTSAWVNNTRLLLAAFSVRGRGVEGSVERLILWDAAASKRLQAMVSPTAILCLAARPGAAFFAEAGTDRMVRLRDANTLEVKSEFRAHDAPITSMEFHPTRPILATASDDLTVKLWDLDTGRCVEELRGPVGSTRRLSISSGGKRLACWADRVTRIWEPKSFTDKPEEKVDADGWENLLAQLKPATVAETGNGWQLRNGVLFSSSKPRSAVTLPGSFGQGSYQMRVKLRALNPDQTFVVLLPVAGQRAVFVFQGSPNQDRAQRRTWVTLADKAKAAAEAGWVKDQVLKDSELHELEITVHVEGDNTRIESRFDDAPLYNWSGPVGDLIVREDWGAFPQDALALGTHIKDWIVYAVKVKRL